MSFRKIIVTKVKILSRNNERNIYNSRHFYLLLIDVKFDNRLGINVKRQENICMYNHDGPKDNKNFAEISAVRSSSQKVYRIYTH